MLILRTSLLLRNIRLIRSGIEPLIDNIWRFVVIVHYKNDPGREMGKWTQDVSSDLVVSLWLDRAMTKQTKSDYFRITEQNEKTNISKLNTQCFGTKWLLIPQITIEKEHDLWLERWNAIQSNTSMNKTFPSFLSNPSWDKTQPSQTCQSDIPMRSLLGLLSDFLGQRQTKFVENHEMNI
jgi:hypothetical protein